MLDQLVAVTLPSAYYERDLVFTHGDVFSLFSFVAFHVRPVLSDSSHNSREVKEFATHLHLIQVNYRTLDKLEISGHQNDFFLSLPLFAVLNNSFYSGDTDSRQSFQLIIEKAP